MRVCEGGGFSKRSPSLALPPEEWLGGRVGVCEGGSFSKRSSSLALPPEE